MLRAALSILLAWALPCLAATAAVRIVVGPTPIINGDARGAHDLTVINERLAFAFAVDTPPPYGVPRGAVIDVAPVHDGKVGRDRAVFADFIPNDWSGWPNRHHRLEVIERGPSRVVVRTVRDWGDATLTTVYTLESGSDHVALRATLHNGGRTRSRGSCSRGSHCGPTAAFCSACRVFAERRKGRPPARSPIAWSPTTMIGASPCMRPTSTTSPMDRATCSGCTRWRRAPAAASRPGCRSAQAAIWRR